MEGDVNPAVDRSEIAYAPAPVFRPEHLENRVTRIVERQAAKVPSDVFLILAVGAMIASVTFEALNKQRPSRFVGMWPAPLLVMGVYNKLVKVFGPR